MSRSGGLRRDLAEDLAAHGLAGAPRWQVLWQIGTRPGLLAQVMLRLQQGCARLPHGRPAAMMVRAVNHVLTGADFFPGCEVGPGLRIEHPSGIVVGSQVVIGRDAFLSQHVTLGERLGVDRVPAYPTLGDGVFVGAGAVVLGRVTIGDGARVGAGAVVLEDIPAGATAVGNPATVVRRRSALT